MTSQESLGDLIGRLAKRVENALQKEEELLGGFVSPATDQAARTLLTAIERVQKMSEAAPTPAVPAKSESLDDLEARLTARLVDGA